MTFRYRRLSQPDLDMTFGQGRANFIIDTPEAVAQSVLTRLNLWQGEWWLDLAAGTPWLQQILGKPRGPGTPDQAIRSRIGGTPFVLRILNYASAWNPTDRSWVVGCTIDTAFGRATFTTALPVPTLPMNTVPGLPATRALAAPQRALTAPHSHSA